MATELIPVVDLRLLSQAELNTLSLSCPNAVDLRRCDDVVVPKIDRSVFNESAGSRKQTYSRLRLAKPPSSAAAGDPSPSAAGSSSAIAGEDDDPGRRENRQIVAFLLQLFARDESLPQIQSQPQAVDVTLATPISSRRTDTGGNFDMGGVNPERALVVAEETDPDRETLNSKGATVDLVKLGEQVDPFAAEIARRTTGMKSEEELLRFLSGLEGQWGSRRKRRRIVDASVFGDDLPRGWRVLLGLKRKEGEVWVNCRRYVSRKGKQFASCKEVSSYILSLIGHTDTVLPVSLQNDGSTSRLDNLTPGFAAGLTRQDDITKEKSNCSSVVPISSSYADHEGQHALYTAQKQAVPESEDIVQCRKCNLTFGDKNSYLQHQLSFHQRSAKRRRVGKSVGDGVIVKDGKYVCQFCHKTFDERHRYNGHIGAHVRYQGVSVETLPNEITRGKIFNPAPLTAVPFGLLNMASSATQKEEACTAKPVNEQSIVSHQSTKEKENHEIDHNSQYVGAEATEVASIRKSLDDQINSREPAQHKSEEIFHANNTTCDKSNACVGTMSPPIDNVNKVAQCSSPRIAQEDPSTKSVVDQVDNCDMINHKPEKIEEASNIKDTNPYDIQANDCIMIGCESEEVVKASSDKSIEPNACLDAKPPLITNVDNASCGMITEISQSSSTSVSVNVNTNDSDMVGSKSDDVGAKPEEVVDINNTIGIKPNACTVLPSLINMDNATYKTSNELDLSSCSMISEIDRQQKVDTESHLLSLSGNGSTYGIEVYTADIFTSTLEDNVLVELDTPSNELKSDFTSCHLLSGKDTATGGALPDELSNMCIDSPLVNGQGSGIEANADAFDIDMKESVLEEMEKPGSELETCFHGNNTGPEDVAASAAVGNDGGRNSLQLNMTSSSSWAQSSDAISILDMIPNQCEDELNGVGQKNVPSLEELKMAAAEASEFDSLSGQASMALSEPPMEFGFATELENRSCPSVELGWDTSTSKIVSSSVCVWCNSEFCHEGGTAEHPSDSLGFICPACKAKISGHLNVLGDDAAS